MQVDILLKIGTLYEKFEFEKSIEFYNAALALNRSKEKVY